MAFLIKFPSRMFLFFVPYGKTVHKISYRVEKELKVKIKEYYEEAIVMPGLDPPTDEEWQKLNDESEKAFDMAVTGAGMVLLSIILGIGNFIIGHILQCKQEQRKELLASDLEISRQGRFESLRLNKELKGLPDSSEKMLKAYRQYSMTKGKVWMGGFWARIPNTTKRYIEDQYEQHPEWLNGTETGWWS